MRYTYLSKQTAGNIRALRKMRGLSQKDMADRLHVGQAYYTYMESGRFRIYPDQLNIIAEALGCSVPMIINFDARSMEPRDKADDAILRISPELKALYEGRIDVLAAHVEMLKEEVRQLKMDLERSDGKERSLLSVSQPERTIF